MVMCIGLPDLNWLFGWLLFWKPGWFCGALEQLGLSCGGRLAAHIVGGRPRPWGGVEGGGRGRVLVVGLCPGYEGRKGHI